MKELIFDFNKLIVHPQFEETIKEISKLNISLPDLSSQIELDYNTYNFPDNGELVTPIEEISRIKLDPVNGEKLINEKIAVIGYDESINRFDSLEGFAYFTSHSLVVLGETDYIPISYLTFYFYTRSQEIVDNSKFIRLSKDPEVDSKKDYINDKITFLEKAVPARSILLIDGPLIGGNASSYMIKALQKFHQNKIIPIFFIKNSTSNMVTENIQQLRNKYNSDMHWSYDFLGLGERTNFFKYTDKYNPNNSKIFCYLKALNVSPQRVEMHVDTYVKYEKLISKIMDMVYYLILVQGNLSNPQVRLIAIAECYARSTLKLVDINRLMRKTGLVPTMNQTRFWIVR